MVSTSSIGGAFITDTTSAAEKNGKLFLDNTQRFLQLFTTQLKYQDPSQPMGTEQMTQQIATLSTVQQSIETNKNLETLVKMQANSQAASATNLINKEVEYKGNAFYRSVNDGDQEFNYSLSKDYKTILVQIADSKGTVVYQTNLQGKTGNYSIAWDGINQLGNPVAEGKYSVAVNGLNSDDQYEEISTLTKDVVSGVDFKANGEPQLVFGDFYNGVRVGLNNVGSVNNITSGSLVDNETEIN